MTSHLPRVGQGEEAAEEERSTVFHTSMTQDAQECRNMETWEGGRQGHPVNYLIMMKNTTTKNKM